MGQRAKKQRAGEGKGPVSWVNLVVSGGVVSVLLGAYFYGKNMKDTALAKERKMELGKAKIGGTFELTDHTGKMVKSEDFVGKWILLYFGFTHCPDICPDEMEKMGQVVDAVGEMAARQSARVSEVTPLFITVDPERDGVKQVAEYIAEFHPKIIGLTGTVDQIKQACKAYRVYFSAGPRDADDDYIVDHTIIIYLIDPNGDFVDYYGQTKSSEEISNSVVLQQAKFEQINRKSLLSGLLS